MSFVVNDIGGPESAGGRELDASYDFGLALRPFGSQVVELGAEARYSTDEGGYWTPRATLGVDIPELGRLRGEFAVNDAGEERGERSWLASAVMSFNLNGSAGSFEAGAGPVFGSALGSAADDRAYANLGFDVAFKGYREASGASPPVHAVKLRVEDTPDVRDHVHLLEKLWEIAEREPRVAAVVLELRNSPADSLAHTQELRDAIHHLRTRGKAVLCHLEDADGAALYLCSAANRILINPAGGVRFAGLRAQFFYFKGLLDKLGIHAEFVRIGDHKSAPEIYTREGASDVARADKIDLLSQYERHFTASVALGRKLAPDTLRSRIAKGPFIAEEARAAGLVDALAFDDEIDRAVQQLVGAAVPVREYRRAPRASGRFGGSPGIALVYVEGDMVDGRSRVVPFLGMKTAGSYTIAETLKQVRESPRVGAVVLRIETGGGSALAADLLWREVERTARVKPVIVSMGSVAASGGYYIAAPATQIFANPLTVTGSIGIFVGKADVSELLRKIGVKIEVYKTTPSADADAFYRPYTPAEREQLEREVKARYDQFLERVATGRKLKKTDVDAVGQGRVWTGEQARAHRLVDELGGLRQALERARSLAGLPDYAPIYELPEIETSLLGQILGIEGLKEKSEALEAFPGQLVDVARALAPFALHPADVPLARVEFAEIRP
jgi:protease-4